MRLRRLFSALEKSYVKGASIPPLLEISISKQLEIITNSYPDNLALISHEQDIKMSYSEMFEKAKRIAANLLEMGVQKGDRVGVYAPNNVEWYLMQMACSLADTIFVTINPAYKADELLYGLNLVELNYLITTNRTKPARLLNNIETFISDKEIENPLNYKIEKAKNLKSIFVINEDKDKHSNSSLYNDFEEYLVSKSPSDKYKDKVETIIKTQNHYDAANIQFTSGTTGRPKGCVLTHHNILNNAYSITNEMNYNSDDVICVAVPFYHCFGMVIGNLSAITSGSTILIPSATFNAEKALEAVSKYNASTIYGVPTMFNDYLKVQEKRQFNLGRLRAGIMAGSLCPEVLNNRVINELGVTGLAVAYGMTETSPISFMVRENDPLIKKTSTVGRIFPHLECKVVNEAGETVNIGEPGELLTKGYSVMKEYYNDPINTDKSIKDGWMYTGDLVTFDKDGYACVVGRIKDLIIRGGENIAPKEVEDLLLQMPQIDSCQVIGVPDERMGEEICALIKLKENVNELKKDEILRFVKERISHFKIPKYVWIVDSFPITVTGKPQKFKMVKDWIEKVVEKGLEKEFMLK